MKLQTGIVGLPNVGKSTLFNALVGSQAAQAANFPFCTIEPNVGIVNVPDTRLEKLGVINNSEKVVPAVIEFVDIAGIVKGASEGAGLGNKFLMVRESWLQLLDQRCCGFTCGRYLLTYDDAPHPPLSYFLLTCSFHVFCIHSVRGRTSV